MLLFIVFRNVLYFAQSRESFDAIPFLFMRRKLVFATDRDT